MPTLKDILADVNGYPDATLYESGAIKTTLGELRQLSRPDLSAVTRAEAAIAERERVLLENTNTLQTAQQRVATLYAEVMAAAEKNKNAPAAATAANDPFAALASYENDNIMGPVVKAMKWLANDRIAGIERLIKENVAPAVTQMGQIYVDDRLEADYERLESRAKDGKLPFSREQLIKHAMDNKLVRRGNIPDISKAFKELNAGTVTAAATTDAIGNVLKAVNAALGPIGVPEIKMDDKGNVVVPDVTQPAATHGVSAFGTIGVPKPTGAGLGLIPQPAGSTRFKSLDEAMAAAKQDPDIWKSLVAAQGGVS